MKQLTLLITAEGKSLLPESEEFLAALGDPDPDYDAAGYAVRNLGFVKFQVFDRLVTEVELYPRNADPRALRAAERLIGQSDTNLFRIRYLDSEWRSEISASAAHTVSRLRELCMPVFEPPPARRFHIEARDPAVLVDKAHRDEGLGAMAMKWRVAFGHFDLGIMEIAERYDLMPLLAIIGFAGRDATPVWRFLGHRHRWAGRKYQVNGIGDKVENMPDKEYGHWTAEFHRAVAVSGQPRLDLITAGMRMIDEAGQPEQLVRYERLLLPWRTLSGETFLTSCAKIVPVGRDANLVSGEPNSSIAK